MVIDNELANTLGCYANVLELGCGSGWLSLELRRRRFNVIGIDPCIGRLAVAKKYAIDRHLYIEYLQADATKLPFRENVFDGLFAFCALHHVPKLGDLAPKIKSVLKESAIISIYDSRNPRGPRLFIKIIMVIYILWQHLIIKRLYKPRPDYCIPSTSIAWASPSENIALEQMDNFIKDFDIIRYKTYFRVLSNFPMLFYFSFRRNEKILALSFKAVRKLHSMIKKVIPNQEDHYFALGFSRKENFREGGE